MKYAVTHCTFDSEAGGNPFRHSSILMSRLDEETGLMEVVDTWGFYGVPTTDRTPSLTNRLKLGIGLDVDMQGNHGMLRHEELRYLELGCGLHGATFELTKEQFDLLQQKCQEMVDAQDAAVREVVETQGFAPKPREQTRIYPYEHRSRLIYEIEQVKAQEQGRESRLKPFEFRFSLALSGPGFHESRTCKSQAIRLLSYVLTEEQIERLTEGGNHPTVPRYSGPTEPIFLHSTGPLRKHTKRSGEVVHYREWGKDVHLYWTIPPQEFEAHSYESVRKLELDADNEYCDEVKGVVRKLQRAEWVLRNAAVPEHLEHYKLALIGDIIRHYRAFSVVQDKKATESVAGVQGFFYSLVSWPRDEDEACLQNKIKQAKDFLNAVYMTAVNGAVIEDDLSASVDKPDETAVVGSLNDEEVFEDCKEIEPLLLAAYLTVEDKKKLCKELGRTYCEPYKEDLAERQSVSLS